MNYNPEYQFEEFDLEKLDEYREMFYENDMEPKITAAKNLMELILNIQFLEPLAEHRKRNLFILQLL
jgi:hypothetical protein